MHIHPVKWVDEVLELALMHSAKPRGTDVAGEALMPTGKPRRKGHQQERQKERID